MDRSGLARHIRRSVAGGLFVFFILAAKGARAQISPGELSKAHSALNGSGHCTECHDTGKRPPEFKCLDCHRDIRERIKARTGLHPSLVGPDTTGRSCAQCHVEHNGRDFNLIHWQVPIQQFNHVSAGYRLEAGHSQLGCRSCHKAELIPAASRAAISVKDLNRTYLGLSRKCSGCHEDVHKGELSSECERCHDPQNWKKPARFDHSRARFSIAGAHEKLACDRCHTASEPQQRIIKYKGLSFQDCSPCHRDPHAGAFRASCRTCHSAETSWKPVSTTAAFDHSKTRFPLLEKHARVACSSCHARGNFSRPVAFAACSDCHLADPHKGQFASGPRKIDCDGCHTVAGFKPATFGVTQHNTTGFPLQERHATVTCSKCHAAGNTGVVAYRIRDFACAACHRDIHESQFAGEPFLNRCQTCHNQSDFKPSTYTVAQHNAGRFQLSGGHLKPACSECHKSELKPVKFRFEDRSCTVCHQDPHNSRESKAAELRGKGCPECHTVNSWRDLSSYDHTATGFALEGAHRSVSCEKCHLSTSNQPSGGLKAINFSGAPKQCIGCHPDPHGSQFASRMSIAMKTGNSAGCGSCHSVNSWHELSGFDHSATDFPLVGAHQSVRCAECHRSSGDGSTGLAKVIDYVNTPRQCVACHEDIHGGQFVSQSQSPECTRCHSLQKWNPSTFNHENQSTYSLSGAHRKVPCASCHDKTVQTGTRKVILYKGTSRECSACHGPETAGKQP